MEDEFADIPSGDLLNVGPMRDQDISNYMNIQSDLYFYLTNEPSNHGYRYCSDRPAKGAESRKGTQAHGTDIQIANMVTDSMHVKVIVFAATACEELHPHTLTGSKCHQGFYTDTFNVEKLSPTIRIPMLEVQITKKRDVQKTLDNTRAYLRATVPVKYLNVPENENAINHHAVKFCYVVTDADSKCHLQTLYSRLIHNTRTNTDFCIEEVSPYSVAAFGGTVNLLMSPKSKMPKDFEVAYFMSDDDGNEFEVGPRYKIDKHKIQKQYVVKVSPPPLSQLRGDSRDVMMKLVSKDEQWSNTISIKYQDDGEEYVARKRKRLNNEAECSNSKVTKYGHCSEDTKMKLQTGIVSKQNLAQQDVKPLFTNPEVSTTATISASDMTNPPDYNLYQTNVLDPQSTDVEYTTLTLQPSSAEQSASMHEGHMTEAGATLCQPASANLNQMHEPGFLQLLNEDEAMTQHLHPSSNLPKTLFEAASNPASQKKANMDLEKKYVPMTYQNLSNSSEVFSNQFGAASSNQNGMATEGGVLQSTRSSALDTNDPFGSRLLQSNSYDMSAVTRSAMPYVQPVTANSAMAMTDNNNTLPQYFPSLQNPEYFQDTNVDSSQAYHANETKTAVDNIDNHADNIDNHADIIDLTSDNDGTCQVPNEAILPVGTHRVTLHEDSYVLPITVDPNTNNIMLTQQEAPPYLYPPGTCDLTVNVRCIIIPREQYQSVVAGAGNS